MSIGYLFSSRHPWLLESQQVLKLSPLLLHHWRCHRWLIHLCRGSKPAYGSQYTSKFHSLKPHNLHLSLFLGYLCERTNCLQAPHNWSTEVSGANSLAVYLSSAAAATTTTFCLSVSIARWSTVIVGLRRPCRAPSLSWKRRLLVTVTWNVPSLSSAPELSNMSPTESCFQTHRGTPVEEPEEARLLPQPSGKLQNDSRRR